MNPARLRAAIACGAWLLCATHGALAQESAAGAIPPRPRCELPGETERTTLTLAEANALQQELEACAKQAEAEYKAASRDESNLERRTTATIGAERARKRLEAAKELVAQAAQRDAERAARDALQKAETARDKAREEAKKDEIASAENAIADATKETTKAERTVEDLERRKEKLKGLIEGEKSERATLEEWLRDLDKKAADAALTADQKKKIDGDREALRKRITASSENEELLTALLVETEQSGQNLAGATQDSKKRNEDLAPDKLRRIALRGGDNLSYGVTLAAVRLRATRDPNQDARERDYRPKAEFVPTMLGLRIVYEPSASPWRIDSTADPLQLIGIEFALYFEKGDGADIDSFSAGVGLTLMDGLVGVGLAFDVYRAVHVRGGTARTGIMPWALGRSGEVTAENVTVLVTIGLSALLGSLTGSTDEKGQGGES